MRVGIPVADLTAGLLCAMGVPRALLAVSFQSVVHPIQTQDAEAAKLSIKG